MGVTRPWPQKALQMGNMRPTTRLDPSMFGQVFIDGRRKARLAEREVADAWMSLGLGDGASDIGASVGLVLVGGFGGRRRRRSRPASPPARIRYPPAECRMMGRQPVFAVAYCTAASRCCILRPGGRAPVLRRLCASSFPEIGNVFQLRAKRDRSRSSFGHGAVRDRHVPAGLPAIAADLGATTAATR